MYILKVRIGNVVGPESCHSSMTGKMIPAAFENHHTLIICSLQRADQQVHLVQLLLLFANGLHWLNCIKMEKAQIPTPFQDLNMLTMTKSEPNRLFV